MADDERELAAALEARVRSALADARLTADGTEFLGKLGRQLRERQPLVSCAWCARLNLAGEWRAAPDELPWSDVLMAQSTRCVCPDCVAALHARDHSY
jgi:hypothetical protein